MAEPLIPERIQFSDFWERSKDWSLRGFEEVMASQVANIRELASQYSRWDYSSGYAEYAFYEPFLAQNVGPCQPADPPFADDVHCLVFRDRVQLGSRSRRTRWRMVGRRLFFVASCLSKQFDFPGKRYASERSRSHGKRYACVLVEALASTHSRFKPVALTAQKE
jgi:hypothetical protein